MFDIKWKLAKLGWWLIKLWAAEQMDIDGDPVQVEEILTEWKCDIEWMAQDRGFGGYEFS